MARASLKDRIFDAAVTTLHQRGYAATSVQDIVDAAQVPKGSFYNHFKSKEGLAVEALDAYWHRGTASLALLADEQRPPFERLSEYFRSISAFGAVSRFSPGCMIGNFSNEMADHSVLIQAKLSALFDAWTSAIKQCVEEGQRDGKIRSDMPAETIAAFLLNSWEGAVLRAKVDKVDDALLAFEALALSSITRHA